MQGGEIDYTVIARRGKPGRAVNVSVRGIGNGQIVRVQQPVSRLAAGRQGADLGGVANRQRLLAAGFDAAAVAGDAAAPGGDGAGEFRRIIGPYYNSAAVAARYGVGGDGGAAFHRSVGSGVFAVAALPGAADEGGAAAGVTGDVNSRAGFHGDGVA
ncbi:hypothetical protein SpAn4DRAFT_5115 [Sporomusa ovata]|uniref:Uncharacterized protein n=1 Tax=Sporomusa ovata TaxID=2378 RepID=A0A0U1L3G7_9FIRM|nr:hypothetical protein SpAn4DRAFT_5115 [Sporomusa ovata]